MDPPPSTPGGGGREQPDGEAGPRPAGGQRSACFPSWPPRRCSWSWPAAAPLDGQTGPGGALRAVVDPDGWGGRDLLPYLGRCQRIGLVDRDHRTVGHHPVHDRGYRQVWNSGMASSFLNSVAVTLPAVVIPV